jgi:DNA primase
VTPEAWASLKQRLTSHAAAIGHADLARMYREDWLGRFYEVRRPAGAGAPRPFVAAPRGSFKNGRFVPPEKRPGDVMKRIGSAGIVDEFVTVLMVGFRNYPEELPAHCEQLLALPIADKGTAKMRDELVNAAFSGATLDRDGLATILGTDGATGGPGSVAGPRAMGFSFTRRDSDPDRARSDLAAAVEIIAAAEEVEKALDHATERLKRDFTDEALEEQQRLKQAQSELRQRLAQLAGTD